MKIAYWLTVLIVVGICIHVAFSAFRLAFGLAPVLMDDIFEVKQEKKKLLIWMVVAVTLFFTASAIALIGGL